MFITFKDTRRILREHGFKRVIKDAGKWENNQPNDYLEVWELNRQILVVFTTWSCYKEEGGVSRHVNGGTIYCSAVVENEDVWKTLFYSLPRGWSGGGPPQDCQVGLSWDIRTDLEYVIETLITTNLKALPWSKQVPMWNLLAPGEDRESGSWRDNPNYLDNWGKLSDAALDRRMPVIAKYYGMAELWPRRRRL